MERESTTALGWTATGEGLLFRPARDADDPLPLAAWTAALSAEHYGAALLLQELVDNGQAELAHGAVFVPYEEAAALASVDQSALGLPPQYPFELRVDSRGTLNQSDFTYDLGYYAHVEGERFSARRSGCIVEVDGVKVDGSAYVLSPEHFELCELVDTFNALPPEEKTLPANLRRFADVKELSRRASAELDRYLADQEVVAPEKVGLKVSREGGALEVVPEVEGVQGLPRKFDRFPTVRDTYTFQGEDGRRQRVVFSEEQRAGLEKVKAHRRVTGDARDALLENPQLVFDPDVFDLDAFSARVVELGFYKPRFYPFVSPYESQWIPGFVVETSPEDRQRVAFETEEELNAFEGAARSAEAQGHAEVEWDGVRLPISEADRMIATARRQFRSPNEPVVESEGGERVLIIEENIEELGFGGPSVVEPDAFEHVYAPPPFLRAGYSPRPYQEEGIAWLQSLCEEHSGALLADDMGLGKTLTVLSFIKWHAAQPATGGTPAPGKPYLVVAPVSLLENWENEYEKFFQPSPPPVLRLYGKTLRVLTNGSNDEVQSRLASELEGSRLCLTTYESMRRKQLALGPVDWAVVVLDEAQKIKTPGTLVTNAAKALKADFKVAMTGTPVENSLVDLWCIVDYAVPGLLGSAKEFAREYQRRLEDPETDVVELGRELRARLGVFIKRRLKRDVLGDLPPKRTHVRPRPMPDVQKDRYLLEVEAVQDGEGAGHEVLRALHAMRAISDHPYLLDRTIDRVALAELIATSAKLQETVGALEAIRSRGEKVILFAERRETQRMLVRVLSERFATPARVINGDTPAGKRSGRSSKLSRQQVIDAFESHAGFNAVIMSPLAAGVGLNVTAANHVIHYSRHWNPAKEDQATDRAYRIGQEKEVHVYYPMATADEFDSFDVVLDRLLARKRELAEASLFPTERVEVTPSELYDTVFAVGPGGGQAGQARRAPLTMDEVDELTPQLFEALVAALWKREGADVVLTPLRRDRGADVAAVSDDGGLLIQVKHTTGSVGVESVQEVVAALPFYSDYLGGTFEPAVVSNGHVTPSCRSLARDNGARVIEREAVTNLLRRHRVTLADVLAEERKRLASLPK